MAISKFFSWVLLVCGILVIAWTLYYSYGIFTGENKIPTIFKAGVQKESAIQVSGRERQQEQMQKMMQEQISKIIPKDTIHKSLNLVAWGILAWIFIFGGFQISSLGIKLMKK
jgi:hypothetical protein